MLYTIVIIKSLVWDEANIAHIALHEVTKDEVDEVCQNAPNLEEGYSGRIRLIGSSQSGRMLAVVLAPKEEHIYYVVTARPASRKERKHYKEIKGGEKAA
jgi:uncharacterized DUF497 family protein